MRILVNSCIKGVDRRKKIALCSKGVGDGRHAVSKITRAVTMKIAEDSKSCNIAVMRKWLKRVSYRRGVDKKKSF